MKAMILAAGYGKRLLPLTENLPKPLIKIGGKAVIVRLIEQLAKQGFNELVINISYLGEQIRAELQDGSQYHVSIRYSVEPKPLETGGGIFNALPLLGDQPFIVVNSDIITDYPFANLRRPLKSLAQLILVDRRLDNPSNKQGDFALENQLVLITGDHYYTYSGIASFHPDFFKGCRAENFKLAPLLLKYIEQKKVYGELYQGLWEDIGNIQRLQKIQQEMT